MAISEDSLEFRIKAVLKEMAELAEIWRYGRVEMKRRELRSIREESLLVSALATKLAICICVEERGRK